MKRHLAAVFVAALSLAPGAIGQPASQRPLPGHPEVAVRPRPDREAFKDMLMKIPARGYGGGDVGVSFCIDVYGRISDLKLTSSSGKPQLDDFVIRHLGSVRFAPANDASGKAIPVCSPPYEMAVSFRLPPN